MRAVSYIKPFLFVEFYVGGAHVGLYGGQSTADRRWVGRVTSLLTYDHWGGTEPTLDGDCIGAYGQRDNGLLADYVCSALMGHYCEYNVF